jgi:NAD(P)-dependent dehydrogenase (short-subunit alcohol dehydrogenase family)
VRRLRAEGAIVVSWDVSGGDVEIDLSDPASVDAAMAQTVREYGVPSIHVASSGLRAHYRRFHELEVDEFDHVLRIDLRGVFLTMRAVSAAMVSARLDGALVAIAGINGQTADPSLAAHSAAAAGVNHMCRIAACDLGAWGIRVNAVVPGPTVTLPESTSVQDQDYVAEVEATTPLCRVGTPDLVADVIVAVLQADWVTGQVVAADGGGSLSTARGRWRLPNAARSPYPAPTEVK